MHEYPLYTHYTHMCRHTSLEYIKTTYLECKVMIISIILCILTCICQKMNSKNKSNRLNIIVPQNH